MSEVQVSKVTSVLSPSSTESCWMRERSTDWERGQVAELKTWRIEVMEASRLGPTWVVLSSSQVKTTRARSPALRAAWKASSIWPLWMQPWVC